MKLYVSGATQSRYNKRWFGKPHAYWMEPYSAAKTGTMGKIFSDLHFLGSHAVPKVNAKWSRVEQKFQESHVHKIWKMIELGIVTEKY